MADGCLPERPADTRKPAAHQPAASQQAASPPAINQPGVNQPGINQPAQREAGQPGLGHTDIGRVLLRPVPVEALAARHPAPGPCLRHVHSLGPARIGLPPMEAGAELLRRWRLREFPEQGSFLWQEYHSYAPPLFVLHDALVYGDGGIIALGDRVIAETLARTSPAQDGYERLAKEIAFPAGRARHLAGAHVSLLGGQAGCYAHAMLDCLARVALLPANYVAETRSALLPARLGVPRDTWRLLDLPPSISPQPVARGEWLHVETLILPLSMMGDCAPHPALRDFYRQVSARVSQGGATPRRLLILRGAQARRRLLNEAELARLLAPLGFVPVMPERYALEDQIRLFRGAEAIVAAHGGALANIGFCRPGTKIFELQMDAFVNWQFRHLAAICGLDYDCLPGRAVPPWPPLPGQAGVASSPPGLPGPGSPALGAPAFGAPAPALDQACWQVSPQHVAGAVARALPLAVPGMPVLQRAQPAAGRRAA